jgi:chemotaxis protein CheD
MTEPMEGIVEVFLSPGEVYFGDTRARIRTLLGSCVAVTLWHPRLMIGGMCHYMMPTRNATVPGTELSGRYADEAMLMLLDALRGADTQPSDYVVKIFGGGNQFARYAGNGIDVATRNVDAGLMLLSRHGLTPTAMHLGGSGHRQVILDLWSGDVWLNHVDQHIDREEAAVR